MDQNYDVEHNAWGERLRRRAKTVPTVLGATAVAVVGLPLIMFGVTVYDLARGKFKLPTVRAYLFGLQYLINDSVEVLLWPLYRFSDGLDAKVMWWSVETLARRAEQLLGIKLDIGADALAAVSPGPLIVICRHVSMFDVSLPALVCRHGGLQPKGVIMAEMLADPGFDIVYQRMGSVFIPRDDPQVALELVRGMTENSTNGDAYVIFPEGRLFSSKALERAKQRLAENAPGRAARLSGLSRVLPPRPGGVMALLEALPEADVLVVGHQGLEDVGPLAKAARKLPLDVLVKVTAQRISRADIPTTKIAQTRWLDELWLKLDVELAG